MKKKLLALATCAVLALPFSSNSVHAEVKQDLVLNDTRLPDAGLNYFDGKIYLISTVRNNSDVPVKIDSTNVQVKAEVANENRYEDLSFIGNKALFGPEYGNIIKPHQTMHMIVWIKRDTPIQYTWNFTATSNITTFTPVHLYYTKNGLLYDVHSYNAKTKTYVISYKKGKKYTVSEKDVSNVMPGTSVK